NVGIRRARGEYILLTNIDIIFSNQIMRFFTAGRLKKNAMYRVDRYDTSTHVPVDADIDAQLSFCENNLIRVNERWGTHPLALNRYKAFSPLVISPDADIYFQKNIFTVESYNGEYFHWLDNKAELAVMHRDRKAAVLSMEIEPGPAVDYQAVAVEIKNRKKKVVARGVIRGREVTHIYLPPAQNACEIYTIYVKSDARPKPTPCGDPRFLYFKLLRIWRSAPDEFAGIDARNKTFINEVPESSPRRQRQDAAEFETVCRSNSCGLETVEYPDVPYTAHTNACGDFTLMHRDNWMDLRGYPEFTTYSMNIDSILCYAAYYAGMEEALLDDSMKIYHIEHEAGSGWTPEGEEKLRKRMAEKGIRWIEWGAVLEWIRHMHQFKCPIIFNLENWGLGDSRLPETLIWGEERETSPASVNQPAKRPWENVLHRVNRVFR
ncbi:MAG: hypothetical protein ACYC9O_18705, partial [Candidatus Latescibacterota bacterium]